MEKTSTDSTSKFPSIFEPKFYNHFNVTNDRQGLFDHFSKSLQRLVLADFNSNIVIENIQQVFKIGVDHRRYYREKFNDTTAILIKKDAELKAAKNSIEQLKKQKAEDSKAIGALQNDIQKCKNELHDEEKLLAKLKKQLKDADDEYYSNINMMKAEYNKEMNKYFGIQDKYDDLQETHLAMIKERDAQISINQSLNGQIEQLKAEMTNAQKQIKEAADQKAAYNKLMEMTKTVKEKDEVKKKAEKAAQKEKISKLEARIQKLKDQKEADKNAYQTLKDKFAEIENEKVEAEKIKAEFEAATKGLEEAVETQKEKIAKMEAEIQGLLEKQEADKNTIQWIRDISTKIGTALKEEKLVAEKLKSEIVEKTKILEIQIEAAAAIQKELNLLKEQIKVQKKEEECEIQILSTRKRPSILTNTKSPKQKALSPSNENELPSVVNPSIVQTSSSSIQRQQMLQPPPPPKLQQQQQLQSNNIQQKTFNPPTNNMPNIPSHQMMSHSRPHPFQQLQNAPSSAFPQLQQQQQRANPYGMPFPQNAYQQNFQQLIINNSTPPQNAPSQFQQYLSNLYQQFPSYPSYSNFNFNA